MKIEDMHREVKDLIHELSEFPQVEAIAIGGSRSGSNYDEKSDYDIYLYCTGAVPEEIRRAILQKYCKKIELGNHFWEYEDNCTLNNGIDMDILYRNLDDFTKGVASVVEEYHAHNGYTTCMWHNLLNCKVIYDKDNRLTKTIERFNIPYPKELKENIISRNMKLLNDALPAYYLQIKKAINRNDLVSINHRISAFLESYFDIVLAVNELTHPGEKRLISLCKQNCKILPNNFEDNLNELFENMFHDAEKTIKVLELIIIEIRKII